MTVGCRLPDGRALAVDPEIVDRLSCGVIVFAEVVAGDGSAVAPAIGKLAAELRRRHEGIAPSQIAGLAEARRLYKSFGMDPSRHRPSSEALLRRVLQGKGLYRISSVVDTCNLASLTFLLPIGMYDLDKVEGDVTLRRGREGEEYAGIRKGPVHLTDRLALCDAAGPFGSPTSDSARTCTDDDSSNILAVVMATAAYPAEAMARHLDRFSLLFADYCGAKTLFRSELNGGGA